MCFPVNTLQLTGVFQSLSQAVTHGGEFRRCGERLTKGGSLACPKHGMVPLPGHARGNSSLYMARAQQREELKLCATAEGANKQDSLT